MTESIETEEGLPPGLAQGFQRLRLAAGHIGGIAMQKHQPRVFSRNPAVGDCRAVGP